MAKRDDYTHKIRGGDLRHAERLLNRAGVDAGDIRDALRTLVGFAEPIEKEDA